MNYDVAPSVQLAAGSLSGGNQQKMVVARELEREVKLIVASQPTRGVDVGSIEYIHKQLIACRDRGNAVLIISSELDEILDLSDRIYVMFEGRIAAEFDNSDRNADRGAIGLAMAGVAEEAPHDRDHPHGGHDDVGGDEILLAPTIDSASPGATCSCCRWRRCCWRC